MWSVTGWAIRAWCKLTGLLGAAVAVAGLVFGIGSGWFWTAAVTAALAEVYAVRQLGREWAYEARGSWWWSR